MDQVAPQLQFLDDDDPIPGLEFYPLLLESPPLLLNFIDDLVGCCIARDNQEESARIILPPTGKIFVEFIACLRDAGFVDLLIALGLRKSRPTADAVCDGIHSKLGFPALAVQSRKL
jgi:hypothetical protein